MAHYKLTIIIIIIIIIIINIIVIIINIIVITIIIIINIITIIIIIIISFFRNMPRVNPELERVWMKVQHWLLEADSLVVVQLGDVFSQVLFWKNKKLKKKLISFNSFTDKLILIIIIIIIIYIL